MLPKRVNSPGRVYITSQKLPAGPYRGVIFTSEWHWKIIVAVVVVVIGFRVKIRKTGGKFCNTVPFLSPSQTI